MCKSKKQKKNCSTTHYDQSKGLQGLPHFIPNFLLHFCSNLVTLNTSLIWPSSRAALPLLGVTFFKDEV